MPTLLSESEVRIEWDDINKRLRRRPPKSASIRSSGVHLSGVIRYALQTAGLLNKDDESDEMPLRMAIGMAWEDWVVGLYPDMDWQPGEWEMDGVFGTPDGLNEMPMPCVKCGGGGFSGYGSGYDAVCDHCGGGISEVDCGPSELVVEEFKATWKSQRTHEPITSERIWMWQLAANCRAMQTLYARLHVLWINGHYPKGAPSPVYKTYLIQFTQAEVDQFWANVILPNKDKAPREEH